MYREIATAAAFLDQTFLGSVESEKARSFTQNLQSLLSERYSNHWHPQQPNRGEAFRCLRWDATQPDESLQQAARISNVDLEQVLPEDLTVWIDPDDVCARIGEGGSIFPLRLVQSQM